MIEKNVIFPKVLPSTSFMDINIARRESDQQVNEKENSSYQRLQNTKALLINLKYTDTHAHPTTFNQSLKRETTA